MTHTTLLTIGEFARLSRLSLKALRLYDELGLLPPAWVDGASGYRHYHPEQLGRAERIALLRRLEVPLSDIRALLDAPPGEAARLLRAHWVRRERLHGEQRALLPYVERLLKGSDMPEFEIHERSVPAQQVLTLTRRVREPELVPFIVEGTARLFAALGAAELCPGPESYVLYHGQVDAESDGPVELCVPFEGSLRPSGELCLREEGARRELYTTLTRAQARFPEILGAYDAVAREVAARGLRCTRAPREVYWRDPGETAPDEPFCHIAYPVTEPGHA